MVSSGPADHRLSFNIYIFFFFKKAFHIRQLRGILYLDAYYLNMLQY